MIVCATLPSLRQFLLHVSPKLLGMGSSAASSNNGKGAKENSEDSELVTFGRGDRKQKKRAIRLPDSLYGMDTFNDVTVQAGGEAPPCKATQVDSDEDQQHDCESQKGILRMKTASISNGGH